MLTRESFLNLLRNALNHLYDPEVLRRNSLVQILKVNRHFDPALALQQVLVNEIQLMKSELGNDPASHSLKLYLVLLYRYIQKLSQEEAANQFAVSDRQLRREQHQALEVLAARIWEKYHLQEVSGPDQSNQRPGLITTLANPSDQPPSTVQNDDFSWLITTPLDQPTLPQPTIFSCLRMLNPIGASQSLTIETNFPDDLPALAVHATALRQIILNLLSFSIKRTSGKKIKLSIIPNQLDLVIQIQFACSGELDLNEDTNWSTTQKLVYLSKGKIDVIQEPGKAKFNLSLPISGKVNVLVIDDNTDIQRLLERFTLGTRYTLTALTNPLDFHNQVKKALPQIIVLDIMMPGIDGWEILERLHQTEETAEIPVIICSILGQKELALAMGAQTYIGKPVTRELFLSALDQALENLQNPPKNLPGG
ncbi:MAG TPA: response regulator [Anaerolineaceae bacterium]